ncbi:hypothetical protein HID58_026232 [Brassica napus]|uniref:Uncharacterized protein n=1 Tax=Brassica napus TaxID=3708 RepID=A0ABQ8CNB4_BRANA|nr:hypothetical protein HID58_026232 [Brassica napus]
MSAYPLWSTCQKGELFGDVKGEGRFLNRLSTHLLRKQPYFSEKPLILRLAEADLSLSPLYTDERILAGIDLYVSNLGLIDRSVASSLHIPGCSVGDL